MKMLKSKKGVLGLERISWQTRRYIFILIAGLSGLFMFTPTSDIVSFIVNFNLEVAPFFSVRNLLGLGLIYLTIAIIYQQVA